jgi:hypothetical protein
VKTGAAQLFLSRNEELAAVPRWGKGGGTGWWAAAAGLALLVTMAPAAQELDKEVQQGKLGAVLANKPAREALQERRRLDKWLASRGDESWSERPGTRLEAKAPRRLFTDPGAVQVLVGFEASEQRSRAGPGPGRRARFT